MQCHDVDVLIGQGSSWGWDHIAPIIILILVNMIDGREQASLIIHILVDHRAGLGSIVIVRVARDGREGHACCWTVMRRM